MHLLFELSQSKIAELGDFDELGRLLSANHCFPNSVIMNRRAQTRWPEARPVPSRLFPQRNIPLKVASIFLNAFGLVMESRYYRL